MSGLWVQLWECSLLMKTVNWVGLSCPHVDKCIRIIFVIGSESLTCRKQPFLRLPVSICSPFWHPALFHIRLGKEGPSRAQCAGSWAGGQWSDITQTFMFRMLGRNNLWADFLRRGWSSLILSCFSNSFFGVCIIFFKYQNSFWFLRLKCSLFTMENAECLENTENTKIKHCRRVRVLLSVLFCVLLKLCPCGSDWRTLAFGSVSRGEGVLPVAICYLGYECWWPFCRWRSWISWGSFRR